MFGIRSKLIASTVASIGVLALTCAKYLLVPFYNDGCGSPPEEQVIMLAIVMICTYLSIFAFSVYIHNYYMYIILCYLACSYLLVHPGMWYSVY